MDNIENWTMPFTVKDPYQNIIAKGTAVSRAINAVEAINLLETNGEYNGTGNYNVTRCEAIIDSLTPLLLCEESIKQIDF